MVEPIHIAVNAQPGELRRAERLLHGQEPWAHPCRVLALVLLLATAGAVAHGVATGRLWGWSAPLLVLGVVLLLAPYLPGDAAAWVRTRHGRGPRPLRLTFDVWGVSLSTGTVDARARWEDFDGALEDEHAFLLTWGPLCYTLVPKRCFASTDQVEAFRRLLRRSLS